MARQEVMQHVIPMLSYEDAGSAADWISRAFGFRETGRWTGEDGRVTHVNMQIGSAIVMLGWPGPEYRSPKRHADVCETARRWSESPYVIDGVLVHVDDIQSHYKRAAAEGARILSPPEENLAVGQRQYRAEDIEGHRWMFAQPTSD